LYLSGRANDTFFSRGLYARPEIEPDAMDDASQGDAMEDTLQGDAMEADMNYADAYDGDLYDTEDTFEHGSSDTEASESVSQGKKLSTAWNYARTLTKKCSIESDRTDQSSSQIEADDLDTTPTGFIKEFPFGRPGAPIPAPPPPHHSATTGPDLTAPGNSIWAPFISQRDWEIAQWAKTEHVTSSAFSKFLAVTEVLVFDGSTYSCANMRYRSLTASNYHLVL
jgi:hypothetical protein